jgi:hypothetical protein
MDKAIAKVNQNECNQYENLFNTAYAVHTLAETSRHCILGGCPTLDVLTPNPLSQVPNPKRPCPFFVSCFSTDYITHFDI